MIVIGRGREEERVTTYIRKSFQLKGIEDYRVLNVRVKYEGGVVAYVNEYWYKSLSGHPPIRILPCSFTTTSLPLFNGTINC